MKEFNKAREQFETVMNMEEMEEEALFYLGRLEFDALNYQESIEKYKELLEKYPDTKYRLEALKSIKSITIVQKLLAKK